jgi:hypothetical protein
MPRLRIIRHESDGHGEIIYKEVLFVGKQYNARIKRQRSKKRLKRKKKLLKEKLLKKF